MANSWGDIYAQMHARREQDSFLIRQMVNVRDRYNGDIVIPLPDVEGSPDVEAPVPLIVADGVDNLGMRASSTRPVITAPAKKPTEKKSSKLAEARQRVWYGRWYDSALTEVLLGRSYRQWAAYGTTTMTAFPDFDKERARIQITDPLAAYPDARDPDSVEAPTSVGMVRGVSLSWLRQRFGERVASLEGLKGQFWNEQLYDIVEWWDEDHRVFGLLGPRNHYIDRNAQAADLMFGRGWTGLELSRVPNRAGMVPVVAPRRVTLDRIEGQVAKITGLQDMLGKLMSLEYLAAQKAVFPDMVALGENGQQPQLVAGRWVDGREGEVNIVLDAKDVRYLNQPQSVSSFATHDRIERAARMNGGVSSLLNGESPGASLRTGASIDAAASFAIDPRVQEAQRVMARHLSTLNEAVGNVEKGYFSGKKLWAFSGWSGSTEIVEYDPAEVFGDSTFNAVHYQFPGSDLGQVTIGLAQMTGSGLMTRRTARHKHPYIDDPDDEERTEVVERLTSATLGGLEQRAAMGELPVIDLAAIIKAYRAGDELWDAVAKADEAARKRQSEASPDPAAQAPGLAPPGMGAESPAPPDGAGGLIPETGGGDLERLRQLMFDVQHSAP